MLMLQSELSNKSLGYGNQCSSVWSCVEEGGWSHLGKGGIHYFLLSMEG